MSNSITKRLNAILAPLEQANSSEENDFYLEYIAPDTASYIRYLASKARRVEFVEFCADDREEQLDLLFGGVEGEAYKIDNTYNYNEPWSSSMVTVCSKDFNGYYRVALAPHYGGDVRGNYGDFIVLTFRDVDEYCDITREFLEEHTYGFELDGVRYTCTYSGGGEGFFLWGEDGTDADEFVPEPWTEEDFLESVRQYLEREG